VLIGVGAAILAHNLGLLRPEFKYWWPLGLMAVGVGTLLSRRLAVGTFLSSAGLYLLLWNNSLIPKGAGVRWPALVVLGGASLLAVGLKKMWSIILGIGMISAGGLFLVDNYYMLPISPGEVLAKGWPALLVLWGLLRLVRRS